MNSLLDQPEILDVPDTVVPGKTREPAIPEKNCVDFEYANALADILPPLKTIGRDWFAYSEGTWTECSRDGFRPAAQSVLPIRIRSDRRANALLDDLEGRSQVAAETFIGFYKFGIDGEILLNVANGIVAITPQDMKLLPHDPTHNFNQQTAAAYFPEATSPIFDRILSESLPDAEDQQLYQICSGNILYPDTRFEVAQINYGEAGRGKSTLAEAIANVLGRKLVTRLTLSQICDPKSYHVPKLRYGAVNLGTELDAVEMSDSAIFKAIVSGEPIEARPIYGAPFTMETTAKLWFLANGLPRFKHGTEAELRRMRFIRFGQLPVTKDNTLRKQLANERDGIFTWVLRGLRKLILLREIPLGGRESRAVHDRFQISNDPVGSFVNSRCRMEANARTEKTQMFAAYEDFCACYELAPACKDWFLRALYERWPNLTEVRPGSGSKRVRVIVGISLIS